MREKLGAGLIVVLATLCLAPSAAQGAASDPLFIFTPVPAPPPALPTPPPTGFLEGPCGLGVDPAGRFYVSDYYHDTVDVYDQNANYNDPKASGATGYLGQLAGIDSIDGPCGLAFDSAGRLYVNDYHRAIKRYGPLGSFGAATTITGATTPEGTHPTGVAVDPATGSVYADQRTYVSVYDESGAPLMEGPPGSEVPIHIGEGSLQDGYGIALSQYPATQGYLYVPDAAANAIEVYDSSTPNAGPVQEIDGADTPVGEFVSLRDAAIAVDRVTGEVYVIDDLQPQDTEKPQAVVYVFHPDGSYEGRLKQLVTDGMPSGLAVDNSATATQGRVYVTSGNTVGGAIYAYGPGAATTAPITLPALFPLAGGPGGEGAASPCASCAKEAAAQAGIAISAMPPAEVGAPPAAAKPRRAHRHKRAHRRHRRAAHHPHRKGAARAR